MPNRYDFSHLLKAQTALQQARKEYLRTAGDEQLDDEVLDPFRVAKEALEDLWDVLTIDDAERRGRKVHPE